MRQNNGIHNWGCIESSEIIIWTYVCFIICELSQMSANEQRWVFSISIDSLVCQVPSSKIKETEKLVNSFCLIFLWSLRRIKLNDNSWFEWQIVNIAFPDSGRVSWSLWNWNCNWLWGLVRWTIDHIFGSLHFIPHCFEVFF